MARLKADSLTHKLIDEIADMILDGGMSAGDRLPSMAELGERFGVSYTVLREALRVLEARGMVEIQHGKGTVVTLDPSGAMAISFRSIGRMHDKPHEHLMEVRSILEVEIARLAAIRRHADDMRELEDAIANLAKSLGDPDAFVKADTQFHYSVVAASHNPLLIKIMQSLREVQTHQWEATTRMREGDLEEAYAVHRLVFESIRDRDPGGAVEAMRQLLAVASMDLQRLMSMQAKDGGGRQ
jgi:GntR family transcriptional repressor for pyruvate dehydrogenase complex